MKPKVNLNTIYELISLLPASFDPDFSPQMKQLFFLYKEKGLKDKEVKSRFLKANQSDAYFSKLKNKLKQELINHLMINPAQWTTTKQKELCDSCHKNFAAYKILLASGRRNTAVELARVLITKTQELELRGLTYMVAMDLEYHYSSIDKFIAEMRKFKKIANEQLEFISAEHFVKSHYNKINSLYTTRNSFPPSVVEQFEDAVKKTLPYLKLKSDKLNKWIYDIAVMHSFAICDYIKVIDYCNKALKSFNPKHPNINAFRFNFFRKTITPLIVLSKLEEAKEIAKEAATLMEPGNYNWHVIILQRIEICFHAGDFQEAYELYKAHKQYNFTNQNIQEYWKIIQAYLYFMIQLGWIEPYSEERFNLGKFLNEIPIYSQDKSGININVLIIQILIEMQREQFGRIIDRIEALEVYARKHTRRVETVRAYIFIQMLIAMEKASFHRAATERKTRKLLQRLRDKPLRMGQNLAVELMPYEVLWEATLGLLDSKFRAQKIRKKKPSNKE